MRWLNEKYYALFQEYWRNFIGSNTWNRIDKDHALCEIWNYFRQTSYWWTHSLSCGWFTQGCMNYGRGAVHQNIKCRYNSCDIGTGTYLPKKVIFLGKIFFFHQGWMFTSTKYQLCTRTEICAGTHPWIYIYSRKNKISKKISALVASWFPHIILHGMLLPFNSLCIIIPQAVIWDCFYVQRIFNG